MTAITIPKRRHGRQSPAAIERYNRELAEFCTALKQIDSPLEFKVSSRGWCYLLEESGLNKGDFDSAQGLINDCRKDGHLPIDFVIVDNARAFDGQEIIWHDDAETAARDIVEEIGAAHLRYTPHSFWDDKDFYIQALVEKIDLKGIFKPVFNRFCIPYANAKGWSDINGRADMMRRFKEWEAKGKKCVLLYCGDHDPGGLQISRFLQSNMAEAVDNEVARRPSDGTGKILPQLRFHRGTRPHLDRQLGNIQQKGPWRPKAPRPQQALRPGLHQAIRPSEGRGKCTGHSN